MNKKYWNKNLQTMTPYVPGTQPPVTGNTIKLNTNENPYPPSPQAVEAIRNIPAEKFRLYPSADWLELRQTISAQYGVGIDSIFCGNGSDEILSLIFRCFANPGDKVVFTYPTYSLYETLAEANGVAYDYFHTDQDFRIDFASLPSDGYAVAIIANPNAPTGLREELESISVFAQRFNGVLLVDEAYIDFCDSPQKSSALSLLESCPNIIVTRTFSKSFSLCGLRVGYAFASPDLIAALCAAKDSYNLDMVAQIAATAAMKDIEWMHSNSAKIRRTKERCAAGLQTMGFSVLSSEANFLFVKHAKVAAESLHKELAKQEIYVRYFKQERVRDYLRISIGTDQEMDRLLRTIQLILDSA